MRRAIVGAAALVFALGCGNNSGPAEVSPTPATTAEQPGGGAQTGNPASEYCVENGGREETREEPEGQRGVCVFPDGSECDSWEYFRQECKPGDNTPAP